MNQIGNVAVAESGDQSPFGPKPKLLWLPIPALFIDERYQRAVAGEASQRAIKVMAADFRWAAFGAIVAAAVPGDKIAPRYAVIDGQHRVEVARRLAIPSVPAVVIEAAGMVDQVAAFRAINAGRVPLNGFALHHAAVAAGDGPAVELARVCGEVGLSIPRYPVLAERLKPGELLSIGAARSMIKVLGIGGGHLGLGVVARACKATPSLLRAPLFAAVQDLLTDPASRAERAAALDAVFARHGVAAITTKADERRVSYGGPLRANLVAVLRDKMRGIKAAPGVDPKRLMAGR